MKNLLNQNEIKQNINYANYITANFGDLLSLNETSTIPSTQTSLFAKLKNILLR